MELTASGEITPDAQGLASGQIDLKLNGWQSMPAAAVDAACSPIRPRSSTVTCTPRCANLSAEAQTLLVNYPWPGNVQELRNMVRRLLMRSGPEEITLEDIESELAQVTPSAETLVKQDLLALSLREAREHFERAYLQQQLMLCHGKVGQLAKRVGMERTHLYRKLRSLGVDFRSVPEDGET